MKNSASNINKFDVFADDLLAERNARPLVIVGASKVDDLLYGILKHYLLEKTANNNNQDELLEGDKPLGTFSARIKMCYRLGLIDKTLYDTLDKLRTLRNCSAHEIEFDIAKSPVREYLAELRKRIAPRQSYLRTKERYFGAIDFNLTEELQCFLLTLCVLLEAIQMHVTKTVGNAKALRIAAK